jgi:hypothetical protein
LRGRLYKPIVRQNEMERISPVVLAARCAPPQVAASEVVLVK